MSQVHRAECPFCHKVNYDPDGTQAIVNIPHEEHCDFLQGIQMPIMTTRVPQPLSKS